jgi:two-component system cell cycle sensor histidine kinase/response regulator CckA
MAAEGIVYTSPEGRHLYSNRRFAEMLGYSETEAASLDRVPFRFQDPQDPFAQHRPSNNDGSPFHGEILLRRNDGSPLWAMVNATPVFSKAGEHIANFAMLTDITERRRVEEERLKFMEMLAQSQKLEAIGTLAGGVAHDFNNILGGVMVGLSLLERRDPEQRHRTLLNDMKALVQRGSTLTQQLLGFSGRGKYDAAPRDLRDLVPRTVELFRKTHPDIRVTTHLADHLHKARVDHAQLEQVLLNLFLNAAHAMPEGGDLLVQAQNAALTATEAAPHGVRPGRFVQIVVTDSGTGIEAAILPHIFEPFFTTRPPGQGSGLGLASVYGIIKNHGGFVDVASKVGEGATFTLWLPSSDVVKADAPPSMAPPLARGTLLMVDDEEQVLRMCGELLGELGYEVLMTTSGRRAVELVREHRDQIHGVLLDLTMPDMSGAATFDAIRAVCPSLPVLLTSGFTVDGLAQELLDRGCAGFLQKPFDATTLSETLQALRN